MAFDIQRSNDVIERTDSTLVLTRGARIIVKYTFVNQSLTRNDIDLTPQKKKVFRVNIENVPSGIGLSRAFHIQLFAQSRWTSYETDIVAMIIQSSKAGFSNLP